MGHWPPATGAILDNHNFDLSLDNIASQLLIWIRDNMASQLDILTQIINNIVSFLFKILYYFFIATVL